MATCSVTSSTTGRACPARHVAEQTPLEQQVRRDVEAQPAATLEMPRGGDGRREARRLEFEAQAHRLGVCEASVRAGAIVKARERFVARRSRPSRDRGLAGTRERTRRRRGPLRGHRGPVRDAGGTSSREQGAQKPRPRTTRASAVGTARNGMPSATSVQTTIAPSMAVLVRIGTMAIAVSGMAATAPQRTSRTRPRTARPRALPRPAPPTRR